MKEMQSTKERPLPSACGPLPGYDILEFSPQECVRDFPSRMVRRAKVRMADEERALLRRVMAEFSAPNTVRQGTDESSSEEPPVGDGSSRLYRD